MCGGGGFLSKGLFLLRLAATHDAYDGHDGNTHAHMILIVLTVCKPTATHSPANVLHTMFSVARGRASLSRRPVWLLRSDGGRALCECVTGIGANASACWCVLLGPPRIKLWTVLTRLAPSIVAHTALSDADPCARGLRDWRLRMHCSR